MNRNFAQELATELLGHPGLVLYNRQMHFLDLNRTEAGRGKLQAAYMSTIRDPTDRFISRWAPPQHDMPTFPDTEQCNFLN